MLRPALALLLVASAAAPAPADGPPAPHPAKIAFVPLIDHAGLDPRALEDLGLELAAAARADALTLLPLPVDALDPDRCDLACTDAAAAGAGAELLLSGEVTTDPAGLRLELTMRELGAAEPLYRVTAVHADTPALVDGAAQLARELFATLAPTEAEPPPRSVVRRGRRGVHPPPGQVVVLSHYDTKSPALAIGLELLFPGAGLAYVGDWGGVALQYAGIFGGFLLVMSSIEWDGDGGADPTGLTLGLALMIGSRVYGIVAAPMEASRINAQAHDTPRMLLERPSLRLPDVGAGAPTATLFKLPALSF